MARILLQTTIPTTEDDWHIGRFGLLAEHLSSLRDPEGRPAFDVVARDRAGAEDDPVLSTIDTSDFDQLWLFAVDTGKGLTGNECAAITRFRRQGGGLVVARDHMDLGSSVCTLGGVGKANFFHSTQPDPDASRHCNDDTGTPAIQWPNYHSGANGDAQTITVVGERHALLDGVDHLPAHPHEGAVGAPEDDASARVIATGCSRQTGREFNLAVVFEASQDGGRAVAESTFHHFADYNWDPGRGCPSFVSEAPGDGLARDPQAAAEVRRYAANIAHWLGRRAGQ
jgi:hypothetical protein